MSDLYDLELVELVSRSTCQIKWQNSYIYYISIISTFKVIQRSTQGQTKMLHIMHLTVLVLFIYGYGAYWKHFRSYFMYVLYFSPWRHKQLFLHQAENSSKLKHSWGSFTGILFSMVGQWNLTCRVDIVPSPRNVASELELLNYWIFKHSNQYFTGFLDAPCDKCDHFKE